MKKMRIIKTVFIICFLLVNGSSLSIVISSIESNQNTCSLVFHQDRSILVVSCKSCYDHGLIIGQTYQGFFSFFCNLIWCTSIVKNDLTTTLETLETHYQTTSPSFYEELSGLSQATDLSIEKLLAAHLFLSNRIGQHCTITLSTSPATKNNQTFLTQNWDLDAQHPYLYLFRYVFSRFPIISRINAHHSYVYLGIPILYEHPLLNDKGLGWGGTGTHLTENKSRMIDQGSGISPYVLVRETMRTCSTVSDVGQLWSRSNRSSHRFCMLHNDWDYDSYAWCDRFGDILLIEQTHSHIATIFENQDNEGFSGILAHTNHHIYLDPKKTGSVIPGENYKSNSSEKRLKRAYELLEEFYGNITINQCKILTQDHVKGTQIDIPDSSDICAHADQNDSYETAIAWIIHPQQSTLYLTHTLPCKGRFDRYDFSSIFDH